MLHAATGAKVRLGRAQLGAEPSEVDQQSSSRSTPSASTAAASAHDFATDDTGEFVLRRDLMDDLADPDEE